jgi:glycosyltransferase A (GT-A) superfamily protein (DUF2064 family)
LTPPRIVAVRVLSAAAPESLAAAMLEDVVDLIAEMQQVEAALVATAQGEPSARVAAWPAMPILRADGGVVAALTALEQYGATAAAVVASDVPDLPPLLVGKLFSALTTTPVAVCPSSDGSLVALAATLAPPEWLGDIDIDAPDALAQLRTTAPARGLHVGSGWHRVRSESDARELDQGLEGWEATRTWLTAHFG